MPIVVSLGCTILILLLAIPPGNTDRPDPGLLDTHVMLTWYGNPRSSRMGALGEQTGAARVARFRAQADAYRAATPRPIVMAYHLVAVVAQCTAGADGMWRRRETHDVIQALLDEARANGFTLIVDIQVGRSTVANEVAALEPFLKEPDVHLALDPEFAMDGCEIPGREIGQLRAADINGAITTLERLITTNGLPPKVLILHQFRLDMLPDKTKVRRSALVETALVMDGFGTQSLKLASYRTVMRQPLAFAGIKLFYQQDHNLFTPAQVLALTPSPAVIVYQ